MSDSVLSATDVSVGFGTIGVLQGLNLRVSGGEFVAIVGPSGCGKTTLLNVLSGFQRPSGGMVERSSATRMVYQKDGLFPWLTVRENITMGISPRSTTAERRSELASLLQLIQLDEFSEHYPHQLSGGMRQRVELARAMAGDAKVLLMDEPFSALDYQTRLRMRRELAELLAARPRTVVFVTHDIEEAAQLADRVVVLSARPATICEEIRIGIPRPRAVTHPQVVNTVAHVLRALGLEDATPESQS